MCIIFSTEIIRETAELGQHLLFFESDKEKELTFLHLKSCASSFFSFFPCNTTQQAGSLKWEGASDFWSYRALCKESRETARCGIATRLISHTGTHKMTFSFLTSALPDQ